MEEKQVIIDLPCKVGDKLYKLRDYAIIEYTVEKIKIEAIVSAEFGVSRKVRIVVKSFNSSCSGTIEEDDINSSYFFSKKAITKLILNQL